MESAWIINFKNGTKIMLNEKAYQRYLKETPKEDVQSEEHWFDMREALKQYPEMDVVEL